MAEKQEVTLHISQVEDKSAKNLASLNLNSDAYHKSIQLAAQYLVAKGKGYVLYGGQWSSGTTWWTQGETVTVDEITKWETKNGN